MNLDRKKTIVLDIQCHLDNNREYIIKELTYAYCDRRSPPVHTIFQPPYDISDLDIDIILQNNFIRKSINGLFWNDGFVSYKELPNILQTLKDYTILVKGNEKFKNIKKYLPDSNVIDLVSMNKLTSLQDPEHIESCGHHLADRQNRCSLIHVHKILNYLDENETFI